MNRQNSIEKFPLPEGHYPLKVGAVHRHWDDQLLVVKDPRAARDLSVDYPVHLWHDVSPRLSILVVTSSGPLARGYAELSRRMESPSKRTFLRNRVTNEAGGSILYVGVEAALAGNRFDKIIISDPEGNHRFDERMGQWLNQTLRCRLASARYQP